MRPDEQPAWIPPCRITCLYYFHPCPGKTEFSPNLPGIDNGYVVGINSNGLLLVGMATMEIETKTDNQQFEASKW